MTTSRLKLDLNDVFTRSSGAGGLSEADFDKVLSRVEPALSEVASMRAAGRLSYLDLPTDDAARRESQQLAKSLAGEFENLVVLGIGGSSLGAKAVFAALSHPFHNMLPASDRKGMRLFFPDNSDPSTFLALLDLLELPRTAFAVVTKSGGTAETASQMCLVRDLLEKRVGPGAFKRQVVAVTDPDKGALRRIAREEGLRTLPVPPGVGGRFSVLTACGLLPAAAAGIDVEALLAGAGSMVRRTFEEGARKSPAAVIAGVLHEMDEHKRRPVHVLMPYQDALRETGDWFVQLWAESLGKLRDGRGIGPTPVRAVGATDQHSLLQLLMEGPEDKFVTFIGVEEPRRDVTIPQAYPDVPEFSYLGGVSMFRLLDTERRATAMALARRGRPSATVLLPRLDAHATGELLLMFEIATSVAGVLYGVDPYDQPGVELGKRYTSGILGRAGYDDAVREVEGRPERLASAVLE